ncbi:MAG: hypothetical protein BGO41_03965 [Clostridiales bacterium 38-18]|nr:MAG: hypothetical protein BGO41_03965 [Clostridiales bacterium 38-18]
MGYLNFRLNLIEYCELSLDPIIIVDLEGKILYINPMFKDMHLVSDDVIYNRLWEMINPYSKWLCQDHFEKASKGDRFSLEVVFNIDEERLIKTEGRFVCIEQEGSDSLYLVASFTTLTDRIELQKTVEALYQTLDLRSEIEKQLMKSYLALSDVNDTKFNQRIESILEAFGKKVYADRAFVMLYDFDHMTFTNSHEWCEKGILPKKNKVQNLPMAHNSPYLQNHQKGETVYIQDSKALPQTDSIKTILLEHEIISTIAIPMYCHGKLMGCVGFDSVKINRTNTEVETYILKRISKIIADAIYRRVNG